MDEGTVTHSNGRRTLHAEVVGGGIGGLTLAVALGRAGWSVRIHEKSPTLRFEGYGIALSLRAQQVLAAIGILEELVEGRPPLRRREARDHLGGLVGHLDWPHTIFFIERTVLLQRLLDIATRLGVEIVTSSEVIDANSDGEITLGDGTTWMADLIVGADGAYSRVRNGIDPASELELLNYGAARALPSRKGFEKLLGEKTWAEFWSGKRRIFVAPVAEDSAYMAFNCSRQNALMGAADTGERLLPLDLKVWQDEFPCLAGVIGTLNETPLWAPFPQVTTSSWVHGRMAVIGDAAHAMAPALGAGGTTAMMDAVSLALVLGTSENVEAKLLEWQAGHRPAVMRLQKDSRFWGDIGYWPNFIQKVLIKLTPHSSWLERRRFASLDYIPDVIKATNPTVSHHS